MQNVPAGFYRISVKALILNEARNKFLIVQESDGKWDIPGGGLDFGETHTECLVREIKEEMGLTITSIKGEPSYFLTNQFESESRKGMWYANVFYEVTLENLDFKASEECTAIKFISQEDLEGMNIYNNIPALAKMLRE